MVYDVHGNFPSYIHYMQKFRRLIFVLDEYSIGIGIHNSKYCQIYKEWLTVVPKAGYDHYCTFFSSRMALLWILLPQIFRPYNTWH